MKREKAILDMLEKRVDEMVTASNDLPDGSEASEEQRASILCLMAGIATLAWVLDQEEEMKPLLRQIRLAGAVAAINKLS